LLCASTFHRMGHLRQVQWQSHPAPSSSLKTLFCFVLPTFWHPRRPNRSTACVCAVPHHIITLADGLQTLRPGNTTFMGGSVHCGVVYMVKIISLPWFQIEHLLVLSLTHFESTWATSPVHYSHPAQAVCSCPCYIDLAEQVHFFNRFRPTCLGNLALNFHCHRHHHYHLYTQGCTGLLPCCIFQVLDPQCLHCKPDKILCMH